MGHHYSMADDHSSTNTNSSSNFTNVAKRSGSVLELPIKTNPIKDDYYITKDKLGVGLNGTVVICIDKLTNKQYALKTLIDSVKARREVTLHYKACQNTSHIVKIVDLYENICGKHKVLFVVMERMEGGELFDQIIKRADDHLAFTEKEVAKIMFQICSAVKHLHDMNIAHRDLKPENLLLRVENGETIIKLTDFGFAKESSLGLKTPCYTPYYAAPEVFGPTQYDKSCDIWSLGVIMYILCCGYPPFYSEHGEIMSPGMKKRIRAGAYTFPDKEWSKVSTEAKKLIHDMFETSTDKRITIDDIMSNKWICYQNVPDVALDACRILKQDKSRISAIHEAMDRALNEMRIDPKIKLKSLNESDNPLLRKRMSNKEKPAEQTEQKPISTTAKNRLNSTGYTDEDSTML